MDDSLIKTMSFYILNHNSLLNILLYNTVKWLGKMLSRTWNEQISGKTSIQPSWNIHAYYFKP